MSLVKHILRKDIHRLRLPLLVWFIALALGITINAVNATAVAGDFALQSTVKVAESVMAVFQLALLALIVPLLMHDEPLSGTTAFWQTRPVRKSDLLRAKAVFAVLFLVLLPTLGKLSMLTAHHVPVKYLLLALPEIFLEKLALVLAFSTAAILTRSFVYYTITVGAVFIAKIALDTVLFMAREFGAIPNLQRLTNISSKNENAVILCTIFCCLVIIVYQAATRKTLHSYILLGLQIILVVGLQSFAPFELAHTPNSNPLLTQEDLGTPEATLKNSYGYHVSDNLRSRPDDPAEKTIRGIATYSGFPSGCFVVMPNKITAALDVENETLRTESVLYKNYEMGFSSKMEIEALQESIEPLELIRGQQGYSNFSQTLLRVSEQEYLRFKDVPGMYSANIELNVFRHKTVAALPLAVGEEFATDTARIVIDAVIQESGGCSVILHEQAVSLALLPPRIQAHPSRFIYLLVNEKEGMAILAERNSNKGRPHGSAASMLSIQRKLHRFSLSNTIYADETLTPEWMENARLLIIEAEWVATANLKTVDDSFKMEAAHSYSWSPSTKKLDLSKILLPKDPVRKEIEKYIARISRNIQPMSAHSQQAEITEKFIAVGAENLELLVQNPNVSYYANGAIKQLVTEEDKVLILDNLESNHNLIHTVIAFGWENEAKNTLIQRLNQVKGGGWYLPTEWISVVANFEDPESYPGLLNYFCSGMNPHCTYDEIKNLPGIEIEPVINKAWRNARYSHGAGSMAPIALRYGEKGALSTLFKLLRSGQEWEQKSARKNIKKFTGQTGTDEELQEWYKANKKQLQFDADTKLFVAEDGASIPEPADRKEALLREVRILLQDSYLDLEIATAELSDKDGLVLQFKGSAQLTEGATATFQAPALEQFEDAVKAMRTVIKVSASSGKKVKSMILTGGSKVPVTYE